MRFDYVSARGDVMPLVGNEYFDIIDAEGQTVFAGNISSSVIGGVDGDTVNNIQAQPRPVILTLPIKSGIDVETAKRYIMRFVKPMQIGSIVWEQNERTVIISGVVEGIEMPRWNNSVAMQITMHCAQPFWEDIDFVIKQISEIVDLHYFTDSPADMLYFPEAGIPFGEYDTIRTKKFYNEGDVDIGLEITILAFNTVTNPIIYNDEGNFFGVGYADKPLVMQAGDNIVITTHKGNKTVTHNGVNVFKYIKPQSTWLQLKAGDNQFSINSDDDNLSNMSFSLIYKQRYV